MKTILLIGLIVTLGSTCNPKIRILNPERSLDAVSDAASYKTAGSQLKADITAAEAFKVASKAADEA